MNSFNYDPTCIADIVFGNDDSKQIIEDIVSGLMPFPMSGKTAILLYGTYGSGKTALARLLSEAIEQGKCGDGLNMDYELFKCQQGHTSTEIITLTKKLLDLTSWNRSGYYYFVFDEVDNLSKAAQGAMKTIMNTNRGIFILTTNNLSNLDKGMKDRSILVEMNAASDSAFLPLAHRICTDEGGVLAETQLLSIISKCNGSFRNVVSNVCLAARRQVRNRQAQAMAITAISSAAKK